MKINSLVKNETIINDILDKVYPIGCYLETSDGDFNPNTSLIGYWEKDTDGLVLVSEGSGGSTGHPQPQLGIGLTGGEYNHTLTTNEMPNHRHGCGYDIRANATPSSSASLMTGAGGNVTNAGMVTGHAGESHAHNNMQPYIVVARWHRLG